MRAMPFCIKHEQTITTKPSLMALGAWWDVDPSATLTSASYSTITRSTCRSPSPLLPRPPILVRQSRRYCARCQQHNVCMSSFKHCIYCVDVEDAVRCWFEFATNVAYKPRHMTRQELILTRGLLQTRWMTRSTLQTYLGPIDLVQLVLSYI
jgi:hypothetical protein